MAVIVGYSGVIQKSKQAVPVSVSGNRDPLQLFILVPSVSLFARNLSSSV